MAVQNGAVLTVGFFADANGVSVPADGHVRPHAGPFTDFYVADYLRTTIDISGGGNPGHNTAIGTDHKSGAIP